MAYTVEVVNGCTKKLVFNFEKLELADQIKAAVLAKQKKVDMKGFRKGKAPLGMVEKIHGPQIEQDALNSFIQAELYQAITKEDLKVIGYPRFENMNYVAGESVKFNAIVEMYPEVSLKDMTALSFEQDKVEVADDDIEEAKKSHLDQKSEMKEVTDEKTELKNGLTAVFNFEGTKEDGTKPAEMKAEEFLLEIGSGQFIPGFEEGMLGLKKGDKKDIEVTFPDEYQAEDLQGKKVTFAVEILEIKEKVLPEFTDEFAKEVGFDSVTDFVEKNTKTIESQKKRAADEKLHQSILEKLIEENNFDIPLALIVQQKDYLKKDLENNLRQQGFTDEMLEEYFNKWTDDLNSKAEFQVRSGLILDSLANTNAIEISETDFEEKITSIADMTNGDIEQIKKYYSSNENLKKNMMYALREEKTFDKIKESITLKTV